MRIEKLYRAASGWISWTLVGGKQYKEGIEGHITVQKGAPKKTLAEAIKQAKEVGGWVEQEGFPAHRPSGPIKRSEQKLDSELIENS